MGVGEQRSQRRRSISWQHFVRRDGAEVDVLRQLPLLRWVQIGGFRDPEEGGITGRSCERNATTRRALCG